MTSEEYKALESISLQRLAEWDLTKRQRLIGSWIVRLSFGRGRADCWIPSLEHFTRLTGIAPNHVSKTVKQLQLAGVLHVEGEFRGPRRYSFLPGAKLIEPEAVVDRADAMQCFAELCELNALGSGVLPGGQRCMPQIETDDEAVWCQLSAGSRERALEGRGKTIEDRGSEAIVGIGSDRVRFQDSVGREPENEKPKSVLSIEERMAAIRKRAAERAILEETKSPKKAFRAESTDLGFSNQDRKPGFTHAGVRARHVYVDVRRSTEDVYVRDVDVGCAPEGRGREETERPRDSDASYALELVRATIPAHEFDKWERSWERRCALAPREITEAVGDVRDYARRNRVKSLGAAIYRRAEQFCKEAGKVLRVLA